MITKTWCTLCLGIQAVFIVEAVLSCIYLFPFELSWGSIIKYVIAGLILLFGMGVFKAYLLNKNTSQLERLNYMKFKRNPFLFASLLKQGEYRSFNLTEEVFVIGQANAPIEVTAFLSLNCNPCKEAFNQLKTLFFHDSIKIKLIFSLHEKDKAFSSLIAHLFTGKKQKEATELLDVWYNAKGNERKSLLTQTEGHAYLDCFELIQKAHSELFTVAEISGTPAIFVNGHKLPREYQIKDIDNFIDVLKRK